MLWKRADPKKEKSVFRAGPPAKLEAIQLAEESLGKNLPQDYREFLLQCDGGIGWLGKYHLRLFRVGDLAQENIDYEAEVYAPGAILFGSNGGGEAYAFDARTPSLPVVRLPFVGLAWKHAIQEGRSFTDFYQKCVASHSTSVLAPFPHSLENYFEVFDIKPIILGGSPTDPANKQQINREAHVKLVNFWNKVIKSAQGGPPTLKT